MMKSMVRNEERVNNLGELGSALCRLGFCDVA